MKILMHVYRSILLILAFDFVILTGMFVAAGIYNIIITENVISFVNSSTFEAETNNTRYYVVKTDKEVGKVITKNRNPLLGNNGDIFVMPVSHMDVVPLLAEFITFNIGGHAGIIADEGKTTIEAMGGRLEEAYVFTAPTDLYTETRTIIGLRVDTTLDIRNKAMEYSKTLVGKDYSYWYLTSLKDKYYCTDLCSRVYSKENGLDFNLDANGLICKTQDLILNKNTFISFVKSFKNGKTNIYYLKEE